MRNYIRMDSIAALIGVYDQQDPPQLRYNYIYNVFGVDEKDCDAQLDQFLQVQNSFAGDSTLAVERDHIFVYLELNKSIVMRLCSMLSVLLVPREQGSRYFIDDPSKLDPSLLPGPWSQVTEDDSPRKIWSHGR